MMWLDRIYVEGAIFLALLVLLLAVYWRFLRDFYRFVVDHAVQAIILVLLYALIYGQIGQGLGLPLLFWSEEPLTRFSVAACSTLLLAVIGLNGYYFLDDGHFVEVMKKVFDFLGEPYIHPADPPNVLLGGPAGPQAGGGFSAKAFRLLRSIFGRLFFDNTRLDPRPPAAGAPFSNPYQLSRFLRLVRLPFLALLAAPAFLPAFFVNLPRFAPVVKNIQKRELYRWPYIPEPDVMRSAAAHGFALAAWLLGIWCGVMTVKVFLFLSDRLTSGRRNRLRSVRNYFASAAVFFWVITQNPIYRGPLLPRTWGLLSDYQGVAPGVAILLLLGLLALLAALVTVWLEGPRRRARPVAVLAFIGFVAWMNSDPFSYRFKELDYSDPTKTDLAKKIDDLYPDPDARKQPAVAADRKPLIDDRDALEAWAQRCRDDRGSPGGKPKLVVVCTSGGAIRAAYWTATVLDRLDAEIGAQGEFHKHVRVITGASGGMVGASYYVTWLRDNLPADPRFPESRRAALAPGADTLPPKGWVEAIPIFSLAPVARVIALRDPLFTTFRSALNWFGRYPDRGLVLQDDWRALNYPLRRLREDERGGALPSLIFSPMTVEDGRRLLISNLDLITLFEGDAAKLDDPPPPLPSTRWLPLNANGVMPFAGGPQGLARISISGIEFFKAFAPIEAGRNDILLATAARMSASFPYISPAVNLPSDPPLRVVDAGYYDNYGVDVAAAWIFANRFWIERNTSGVLVVQVRDALSEADRVAYPAADNSLYAPLFRGVQFLFSPIEGAMRARYSSSSFRNDALIAGLSDYFAQRTRDRAFFTTAIFELSSRTVRPLRHPVWDWPGDRLDDKIKYADSSQATEVAMSWYLTVAERMALDMAIPYDTRPGGYRGQLDADGREQPAGIGTRKEQMAEVLELDQVPPDLEVETIDVNRQEQRVERIKRLAQLVETLRKGDGAAPRKNPALRARALYVIEKELARARNDECLRQIDYWWRRPAPKR
jgi:hypothetical protein